MVIKGAYEPHVSQAVAKHETLRAPYAGGMKVAAITGSSGAGKSTLILRLIEHYRAAGQRVGCIKHTHHPLNEEDRGDTGRFRAAGAEPVLLAREGEAVIFDRNGTRRVHYTSPRDLLTHFDTDIVLIEGFKDSGEFPRLHIDPDRRPTLEEALAALEAL
jgi:molybdopterin-guanine dinucleotide biosynthesis protein B